MVPARGQLHLPPATVLSWLPNSPRPDGSVGSFRTARRQPRLHTHARRGEGGRRAAAGVGRGSQGNGMNLFSEKHGVQTGGFLLSCFSSVKASINSTLIIKSEQCVFGFQQLNSVTAVSLGSRASFTTRGINIFFQGAAGLLFLFSSLQERF